ncbi:hypothetical protein [Enterocloster bolteae]|uniref:hypothetical protein n=1 Tax=Enterocloster bolteae TaxID=208479 RepID=UPI0028DC1EF6|nr:hypothetical protein [Enterocloster bolteae]
MRKKLISAMVLGMAITILSGIPVMASGYQENAVVEIQTAESSITQKTDETTVNPRLFGKKKTVKKNYHSIGEIPESIYYEEYIDGAWYGGDLSWTGDAVKISGTSLYEATFKGTLDKI